MLVHAVFNRLGSMGVLLSMAVDAIHELRASVSHFLLDLEP